MSLTLITPILRIFDVAKAKDHYLGFLGFDLDWEHRFTDNSPLYCQISKDDCILHLSEHHGDGCPGSFIRIKSTDLGGYCATLKSQGYRYYNPSIQEMPWGTNDMSITDPFGNRLIFWEDTPKT
ncbi:MAG TPA: glyoxalase superfamily protein [Prosthecobacter sp.]|nr:glyoxalase superfamily protein [Prosthecobacter sp.]